MTKKKNPTSGIFLDGWNGFWASARDYEGMEAIGFYGNFQREFLERSVNRNTRKSRSLSPFLFQRKGRGYHVLFDKTDSRSCSQLEDVITQSFCHSHVRRGKNLVSQKNKQTLDLLHIISYICAYIYICIYIHTQMVWWVNCNHF